MTDHDFGETFEPPPFAVNVDVDERIARIAIVGEIDLSTADAIEHQVLASWEESHRAQLLLDLRGVTFMDSTGLRLLMALHAYAREHDYRLRIARAAPPVHRPVEIAGLGALLEFTDDLA